MPNNKQGKLPNKHSQTAILIKEASELRENIHTELAIRILKAHGYDVTQRSVYSLLNGGAKWFVRVGIKQFRLTREGHVRAIKMRGLTPLPQAIQKKCKRCKNPFIDESPQSNQQLCGKDKCKLDPWTEEEKYRRISEAAKNRLDKRKDGLIR